MSSLSALRTLGTAGGFAADRRFTLVEPAASLPVIVEPGPDPLEEAFERGRRQGVAEATDRARAAEAERDGARRQIELAFSRMNDVELAELRDRLRLTVLALCEEAIAPLALDLDALALRVERAAAMLRRAQDEKRVALNPEDFALVVARLPAGLEAVPDPLVERGSLRIDTADGGIEDGPGQWRRILAEAFREC